MKSLLLAFTAIFCAPQAFAYLPPAHFLYSKIGEQKLKITVTGVTVTVSRPQTVGTEEILGTLSIPDWKPASGGWPGLSLVFHGDAEALIQSVSAFGLKVLSEADLMRVERSKLAALKDPPDPFYKPDPNMALKRTRQTYAWVHLNAETGASVWVEKDSFLPLKIAGPCPAGAATLSWAKAGDNKCELEYRNLSALRRGNYQSARLTLWKDGAPLFFLTFERLGNPKTKLPPSDEKLSAEVKEVVENVLH